jgi:inner membrane protein
MPSIFSHAVFATSLGKLYASGQMPLRFWFLTIICSILPDADVVGLLFDIRYAALWGHRGITHSLVFAFLTGCLVALVFFRSVPVNRKLGLMAYFTLVTASHPLLDALTNGGLGVAIFAPFDTTRYFLPWRPIEVSPIGAGFFSWRGLYVFINEIKWIWIPSMIIFLVGIWYGRKHSD